MGYIGAPAVGGFSSTKKDSFSGDNSTTGFTMSKIAAVGTDIQVFVDNYANSILSNCYLLPRHTKFK